jgi:hypothetical protein
VLENVLDTVDIVRDGIFVTVGEGEVIRPPSRQALNLRGDQNAALCNLRFAGVPGERRLLATF